jgi:mannitol-specific phosphotransferase system IIBC component
MHIGKNELISFKIAVNEAIETYGLTLSSAALRVINIVSDYNKKGQLKRELAELSLHKYAINEFCSSRSQVINALANLCSHGITEQKIISLNNFLANNKYNINSSNWVG